LQGVSLLVSIWKWFNEGLGTVSCRHSALWPRYFDSSHNGKLGKLMLTVINLNKYAYIKHMWPRKKCQLDISLFLANYIDLCVTAYVWDYVQLEKICLCFSYMGYPPILQRKINLPIFMHFPSPLLIYFQKIISIIKACFIYWTK
jgi:hypothetical protein